MLLSSCPRCHDSIRIPALAKEMSVIRCPRCAEEFPLSEIFSSLPPEAEIISGPGSEVTIGVPAGLADTTEYNLAGESPAPTSDFQIRDSGPLSSSPPMAKIDSSRPPRKPKKPQPNAFLEFAKIIVGGAAGLLIAVMAIMWFSHQDVLKIVPKLPPQAYFLVPEELRTAEMRALAAEGSSPAEIGPESDVPVESIPGEQNTDEAPEENTPDTDNQVSRNQPAETPEESPFAAAFQQQVEAAKQRAATEKQPKEKPKSKPTARKVNAEMPVSEPIAQEEPAPEPKPTVAPEDVAETPMPQPKPEPTEPSPIEPMLLELVTEASEELGPIGAEIPPRKEPGQPEPLSEGSVDLSPVDDGDK